MPEDDAEAQQHLAAAAAQYPDAEAQDQAVSAAARFVLDRTPLGRAEERANSLGENLGKIAGVVGPALGKGAVAAGKAALGFGKSVLSGAQDSARKQNAQAEAEQESFSTWRDRVYGVRGQQAADEALANADPVATQRADLAGNYVADMAGRLNKRQPNMALLARRAAFTLADTVMRVNAKGIGQKSVQLNRLVDDLYGTFRAETPEVLAQLGAIMGPKAAPVFEYLTNEVAARGTPGAARAQAAARDALATQTVALVDPAAQNKLLAQGINLNTPSGREQLLGIMEDFADGIGSGPGLRKALEDTFGADSVKGILELLNGQQDEQPVDTMQSEPISEFEQRVGEKLLAKNTGPKVFGFHATVNPRSSLDGRDMFAPTGKPGEDGVVKRPSLFKKGQQLFGGKGDAIEKKIADIKQQLSEDPAYPDHDNYRVEARSAHDVMKDAGMQPGKVLQLYRDYMHMEYNDEKNPPEQKRYFAQQMRLANNMIRDGMDPKSRLTAPGERKELTAAAEKYFKDRFVVVGEQLSNQDPSKITLPEVLAMHKEGQGLIERSRLAEDRAAALSDANVLMFKSDAVKGGELAIPAGKLVKWVKEARGKSSVADAENTGGSFSNKSKDEAYLADVMEGIAALIGSGRVKGMPYKVNEVGKAENFSQGVPDSLRLATKTYGAMKFADQKRQENQTPKTADELAPSAATQEKVAAEQTVEKSDQTEGSIDDAHPEIGKAKTEETDKTPLDFQDKQAPGEVADEFAAQRWLSRQTGASTDAVPGPESKGTAVSSAEHRAEAITAAFLSDPTKGQEMIRSRIRMALVPEYTNNKPEYGKLTVPGVAGKDQVVGGVHYIAPVAAFASAKNLTKNNVDLPAKTIQAIQAKVANILLKGDVSPTEQLKIARLLLAGTDEKLSAFNVKAKLQRIADGVATQGKAVQAKQEKPASEVASAGLPKGQPTPSGGRKLNAQTAGHKWMYHGTRAADEALVQPDGSLLLKPSKNLGGKTFGVSFTHDQASAKDYAVRIKGGGPKGFTYKGAKLLKIDRAALTNIEEETFGEWADYTGKDVVIPKGSYTIEPVGRELHLMRDSYLNTNEADYSFKDYLKDNYSEMEREVMMQGDGDMDMTIEGYLDMIADPESGSSAEDVAEAKAILRDQFGRGRKLNAMATTHVSNTRHDGAFDWRKNWRTGQTEARAGAGTYLMPADAYASHDNFKGLMEQRMTPKQFYATEGKFMEGRPAIYDTRLDAEPHEIMLWDEPFSKQPKEVQDALLKAARELGVPEKQIAAIIREDAPAHEIYGYDLYNRVFSLPKVSDALDRAGIVGAKYRSARGPEYVVYRDSKITTNYVHFNNQDARTGTGHVSTQAERDEAVAYATKILGPKITVAFKDITGYSGEFIDARNAIEISTTAAAGTLGTLYHEAMHVFFRDFVKGNPRVQVVFESLINDPKHLAKLHALLDGYPAAQAQLVSGEERLAYTYQFWKAGLLEVDAKAHTWLQKLGKFFRRVAGMVRDSERALELFQAFDNGKMSEPSAAGRVIAEAMAKGTGGLKMRRKMDALFQGLAALTFPSAEILGRSVSPTARKLGTMFFTNPGEEAHGKEEIGLMNARRSVAQQYINTSNRRFETMSEADQAAVQKYLQSEAELADIPYGEHRAAVKDVRDLLDRFHQYMTESGMKIGKIDKYYPTVWSTQALLGKKQAFTDMLVGKYAAELSPIDGDVRKAAERVWQSLVNKEGVDAHLPTNRDDGVLTPFFASQEMRTLPWLKGEDKEAYLEKDMPLTLTRYFSQGAHATEYFRRFGENGKRLGQMLVGIGAELTVASGEMVRRGELADEKARVEWVGRQMRDVTQATGAMEGSLGKDVSPNMRKFNSWMAVYQNIRLLPMALFSSFVDPLSMVARGAPLQAAYETFVYGMREVFRGWADVFKDMPPQRQKDEWRKLAEAIGASEIAMFSNLISDQYSSTYMTPGAKRINDKMFVFNGMEAWNRGNRIMATKWAVRFIEQHAALPDRHHSARWLTELGLTPAMITKDAQGNLITNRHELAAAKGISLDEATKEIAHIHNAINRWVEGAVLTPNAAQRPSWSSDPSYASMFHLKQFSYSFHQTILKRATNEFKHGNMAPLGALALFVPTMIGADIMKGLIQGAGTLPPYMAGMNAGDWVMHGVQRAGLSGIGVIGMDAATDWASLGGPAFEQIVDAARDGFGSSTVMKAMPLHALYGELAR